MTITLYGIPTCESCRKALRHLRAQGLEPSFVDLRQAPPDRARVAAWVGLLGSAKLRNTSGASYRALGAAREAWSEAQWIDAFVADPMLLKRPILELGGNPSTVGFDPALWDMLLQMAGLRRA